MKQHHLILTLILGFTTLAAPAAPPPPPGGKSKGGPGGSESAEMQALLKSFNLSSEQQAKYDAVKKKTGEEMRAVSVGKRDGTLTQDQVLEQALAAHKAFNAAVQGILAPAQYDQWLPLREADHHKIAAAHKARDEAEAKKQAEDAAKPEEKAKP